MAKFLRFLLALAGLPFAWGVTRAAAEVFRELSTDAGTIFSADAMAVAAGFVACFVFLLVLPLPIRLYVFGHELTHAFWGVICGAKVTGMRVGADGGSVTFETPPKSRLWNFFNVWVTLSPYVVPFYTLVVISAAAITRAFVSPLPWVCVWLFMVGATWCFHVVFTLRSIFQKEGQPDLKECGYIFSYVFIWVLNVAEAAAAIVCTTEVPWSSLGAMFEHSARAYRYVGELFMRVYESVCSLPVLQG